MMTDYIIIEYKISLHSRGGRTFTVQPRYNNLIWSWEKHRTQSQLVTDSNYPSLGTVSLSSINICLKISHTIK